jgi:hypothetical protein
MQADFVFVAKSGGYSSLSEVRCGVANLAFGEDEDPTGVGQFDRSAQSGDPGSNDQEVTLGGSGLGH